MDRAEQLRHLPSAYAVALRMRDAGADAAMIAVALGIEPGCVGPILELAEAKADRIAKGDGTPDSDEFQCPESS